MHYPIPPEQVARAEFHLFDGSTITWVPAARKSDKLEEPLDLTNHKAGPGRRLTKAEKNEIKALHRRGVPTTNIADKIGCTTTTVNRYI